MMKTFLKAAVNTVLSVILTPALILAIFESTCVSYVIESELLFEKLEENGAYEDKIAQIKEEIEVLVVNSGVDEAFIERILPSDEMVINAYKVSVSRLLGRSAEPVSTESYKATVTAAFSEKALEHGITEQDDINEITSVYWQDISEIFTRVTSFIGAGTVGSYVSVIVSAADAVRLPAIILAALVYLFMLILNRKSGTFYSVIPFISQSALLGAAYFVLDGFIKGKTFDSVQLGLLTSAEAYLIFVLKISLALTLAALLIFAINITINLIRGKKIGKKQEI